MTSIPKEAREIYSKYLTYTQGEAFLFGKGAFAENKYVWVAVSKDKYTTAEVISKSGGKLKVRTPENEEVTVDEANANWVNPPKFDGVHDCAELGHLNEAAVLYNLKKRYDNDVIYVSIHAF